jgi:hypothetical protein
VVEEKGKTNLMFGFSSPQPAKKERFCFIDSNSLQA